MLHKNELHRVEEANTLLSQLHSLHKQVRLKEAIYAPFRNMHAHARDTIAWTSVVCMHMHARLKRSENNRAYIRTHARDISAKQVRK